MKKKYLEIFRDKEDVVVQRMDVTTSSERTIEKIEGGVNINLNHNEFTTRVREYDQDMPESDEKQ